MKWRLAAITIWQPVRAGPSTESGNKPTTPCRTIKIVALTGQLCATDQLTPDRDRTRYSKNAWRGWINLVPALASFLHARCVDTPRGLERHSAAQAEYDRSAAQAWSPRLLKSPRSNIGLHRPPAGSSYIFGGRRSFPKHCASSPTLACSRIAEVATNATPRELQFRSRLAMAARSRMRTSESRELREILVSSAASGFEVPATNAR